jgi:FMN phosphatase YigB (HAD superfamily)
MEASKSIFVDVDDTLIRSVGTKRIPMTAVVAEIKRLRTEGATLYLWSSGGAEYCRSAAVELGIEDCFEQFLPKPTAYIDDQPVHEWRLCRHLYPSQTEKA